MRLRAHGKHRKGQREWAVVSGYDACETYVRFTADGPGNDDLRCKCGRIHYGGPVRPEDQGNAGLALARNLQWLQNRNFQWMQNVAALTRTPR